MLVLTTIWVTPSPAHAKEKSVGALKLEDTETLYTAGDFDTAARRANDLLVHEDELPAALRARLYLVKARLELAFGRKSEIRLWLAKARAADPALTVDPVKDPPELVAVWEELRRRAAEAGPPAPVHGETSRFWPSLLPFGIGQAWAGHYRNGALYLTAEAVAVASTAALAPAADADHSQVNREYGGRLFGALAATGIYSYSIVDLLPTVTRHDARLASDLRYALAFAPFGAGQAANGHPTRAFAVAVIETALLSAATFAPDGAERRAALGMLGLTWGASTLDALLSHGDPPTLSTADRLQWQLGPHYDGKYLGAVLALAWPLREH